MLFQNVMVAVAGVIAPLVRSAVLPLEYHNARNNSPFNNLDDGNGDTLNNTLAARDDNHPPNFEEIAMLAKQNDAYRGFFWESAYPNAAGPRGTLKDGGCNVTQYNIIVNATRDAVRLGWFAGSDLFLEDRSFNKFFVRNRIAPAGGRWTSSKESQNAYASIKHNMLQPSRFPLHGIGKHKRRDRIAYQCKDTEYLPPGKKGCKGSASAYTADPSVEPRGWTIVLCPDFFSDYKDLQKILDGPKISEGSLGPKRHISREQMILHEWLHNDLMGYHRHLDDLIDQVDDQAPKRKVYGRSEAQSYAWKFMTGNKKHINQKVINNVENYVWYFVDKMYGRQWKWTGDGNPSLKLKQIQESKVVVHTPVDLGDDAPPVDPSTIPAPSWPTDCHGPLPIDTDNTTALVCDHAEEPVLPTPVPPAPTSTSKPPTVTKLPPDPKNCNCNESRCTPESPDCCANGTCPTPKVIKLPPDAKNCNCNESRCTPESPDCCANGTCPGSAKM